jgi:hypothetical protein
MDNKSKRDAINAARVIKTAECVGVSTNLVQKVIRGERNNDKVWACLWKFKRVKISY